MNTGAHHLHIRKRKDVKHETFPSENKLKLIVDNIAFLAFINPIMTIPQLVIIYTHHTVAGLSLLTWVTYGIGSLFWSFYGFLHKENAIIYPNIAMAVVQFGIVAGILLYR